VGDGGEVRYLSLLYVALRTCTVLYGSDQTKTKARKEFTRSQTLSQSTKTSVWVGVSYRPLGTVRGAGHAELKPSLIGTETAVDALPHIVPYRTVSRPHLVHATPGSSKYGGLAGYEPEPGRKPRSAEKQETSGRTHPEYVWSWCRGVLFTRTSTSTSLRVSKSGLPA
jgi:hypothetical protein